MSPSSISCGVDSLFTHQDKSPRHQGQGGVTGVTSNYTWVGLEANSRDRKGAGAIYAGSNQPMTSVGRAKTKRQRHWSAQQLP